MTSDTPGSGTPGWGQPPQPAQPPAEPAGGWPVELVPPDEATQPLPTPVEPAAPAPAQPTTWGQPATPAAAPVAPAPDAPVAPSPAPAAPAQPAWGTPPAQQPAQPQPPVYGAPVAPAAAPGGQWGAPPPQQPGAWAPPPGAPGTPGGPPAGWAPAPAKSGNGCLKACLIVGIIGVVLVVIAIIALTMFSMKIASDIGLNGDGTIKACEYISESDLQEVLGTDATALPMAGLVDATLGQALDKRLLTDTASCWAVGGEGMAVQGRLAAKDSANASSEFASARQTAQDGAFLGESVSGVGDEAFCTTIGETGGSGVFVRAGGRLVYVSLIDPMALAQGQEGTSCALASKLAEKMIR